MTPCERCDGTGVLICRRCAGTGRSLGDRVCEQCHGEKFQPCDCRDTGTPPSQDSPTPPPSERQSKGRTIRH